MGTGKSYPEVVTINFIQMLTDSEIVSWALSSQDACAENMGSWIHLG